MKIKRIVLRKRIVAGVAKPFETFLVFVFGRIVSEECDIIALGFNRFSVIVFNFEIGFYVGRDYAE